MRLALNRDALCAVMLVDVDEIVVEHIVDLREDHLVLRTLWPCKRWNHAAHVERKRVGENRVRHIGISPQALFFGISLNERNLVFITAGQAQIFDGLCINAKEATGRTIFRRHVGKRRTVGKRQGRKTGAIIFHKAANNTLCTQHLRCGQHKVGRGYALGQRAGQFEANDFGDQHRYRLAKHCGLGLNTANAPTQHAKTVDHRRVAVCAHAGVWVGDCRAIFANARPYGLRDMLQIDLMANAGSGGDCLKIVQRF